MGNPICIDYETFYSSKLKYSLTGMIAESYVQSHLFEPYMISVYDGKQSWVGDPRKFNWAALDGEHVIAHNAYFEQAVTKELLARQWIPKINIAKWSCTANLSAYLCQRRGLAPAMEKLYGIKVSKDARGSANGKHWPTDFPEDEQKAMLEYAQRDAIYAWRLFNDYSPRWPEVEQELSRITIEQGLRGVKINRPLLDQFICQSHEMLKQTEGVIPWIKDAVDGDWDAFFEEEGMKQAGATSTKCIAEQCRRSGIPCAPVKSEDEEAYELWEATFGPAHPWIAALGSWRSINKLYKTFLVMKSRLRADDTMPFALLYFGAHCLPGNHEVLTPTGWCRLDQWTGGEIMQWDGENLVFDTAFANQFEVTNGERLLRCKTGQIDAVMTEGHWLSTYDAKTGVRRKEQAGLVRTKRRNLPISGYYSGPETVPPWKVKLLAAIQADGHYLEGKQGLRFRFTRARKITRMRAILSESGLDWTETRYPSEPHVTVFLVKHLPAWACGRKEWGAELLTWTQESLTVLMNELVEWDGHQSGPDSIEYTTTSKNNADWITTVAHLTGRAATRSIKKREGWSDAHRVSIRTANRTRVNPEHWSDAGAAKTVYCPTAKLGTCLFRNGDSIFITHQTGRWSATAKVNFQNQRRKPIFCNEYGLLESDERRTDEAMKFRKKTNAWPEWVKYAIDFRNLIIPRDGRKMIVSDLSQIEPRCLAWLTGDTKLFDMLRHGIGIYEAHARATMGWQGGSLKTENEVLYALAKVRVLGLGYGAGWEKFITMASALSGGQIDLTKDDPKTVLKLNPKTGQLEEASGYGETSRKIVNEFRESNAPIVGLWRSLDDAMRRSQGGDFVMTLPSGRKMTYENVRAERRIEPDPETKLPRSRSVYTVGIGTKRTITYGGKLTENLVQATARDVFGHLVVNMEKRGWTNLFSVHDEAVLEVPMDVTAKDVEEEMSKCPEWLQGCPVGAEAKEVPCYQK